MIEEQKQENGNVPAAPGYYKDTGSKVTDFFIGFLGYPIAAFLIQLAMGARFSGMRGTSTDWIASVISLGLMIFCVVYSFKRGRKFIGIGILSLTIVPLIAAGSCLLIVLAVSGR